MNKVILIGHVGRDAELKFLKEDLAKLSFSLATSDNYKEKKTTEWHNIVMFGKRAEKLTQYVTKGSQLVIEGKVANRQWEKDGVKHYRTEIICDNLEFVGAGEKKEYKTIADVGTSEESVLDKSYVISTDQTFTNMDIPF